MKSFSLSMLIPQKTLPGVVYLKHSLFEYTGQQRMGYTINEKEVRFVVYFLEESAVMR
jgi:hypothetical protein